MTSTTSGAWTGYPSWSSEFTLAFDWDSCCSVLCVVFCRSLFVALFFLLWQLLSVLSWLTASGGIFNLFSSWCFRYHWNVFRTNNAHILELMNIVRKIDYQSWILKNFYYFKCSPARFVDVFVSTSALLHQVYLHNPGKCSHFVSKVG